MRMMLIVTLAVAGTSPLAAQTRPDNGLRRGDAVVARDGSWQNGRRWGYRVEDRWIGGLRAPGGWSGYRPPVRGWAMPRYWIAPHFRVNDFAAYGLSAPAPGYRWYRYYDDAVLIDRYGRVHDSVRGVDWNPGGDAYADLDPADLGDKAELTAQAPPAAPARRGAPYPLPPAARDPADVAADRADGPTWRADPAQAVAELPPGRFDSHGAPYAQGTRQAEDADGYDPAYVAAVRSTGRVHTVRHADGSVTTYHPPGTRVTTRGGYVADGWYYPPVTTTTITVSRAVRPCRCD